MIPIAIATMMEHIGDICAIGATVGKDYINDPGLHRTLIGDGLAHHYHHYSVDLQIQHTEKTQVFLLYQKYTIQEL